MKNIQYVRAEGTEGYHVSVSHPSSNKYSTESAGLIKELQGALRVGERKNLDRGDVKWNITIDEFSVLYMGMMIMINQFLWTQTILTGYRTN